jgi:hypothetical protein
MYYFHTAWHPYICIPVDDYMVTNTMSPTTIFEHIGSVKNSDGVLRIDIKTM